MQKLIGLAQSCADIVIEHWPLERSAQVPWPMARVIGHRGARGPCTGENSLKSFADCARAGLWGIEFDVRWTKDEVPVVVHDDRVSQMSVAELKKTHPNVPLLAEVIAAHSPQLHLMIELKETLTGPRERSLSKLLSHLVPRRDYHLLTLNPALLKPAREFSKDCFIFVTELNFKAGSQFVLREHWGGIAGHYLFMTHTLLKRHHDARQVVGVGFVKGPRNLRRQLLKGADFVFSNHPLPLQLELSSRLDDLRSPR
jgi:glycerophosphoryl diester phosphodiesterase